MLMCMTCNCFKHNSKDIYYTAFSVILIKHMIVRPQLSVIMFGACLWGESVNSSSTHCQRRVRCNYCGQRWRLTSFMSRFALFHPCSTHRCLWLKQRAYCLLRALSRYSCCQSHCCSKSLKQFPHNFECGIRYVFVFVCESWPTSTHCGWSKYAPNESNMADGRHLEKSKHLNIFATDWPILTKFGM